MNLDKWNALPANVQKVFTEVSEEWIEKHGKVWDYYDKVGVDYFLSLGEGREVIELSSEEMNRWVETAVAPLIQQYIEDKTAAGLPAAEYEDYLLERVQYWSSRAPTAQQCVDYVESELADLMPED
jgi:TRAP-type C4-dicarboxylate transport system substrate-binding protein